VPVVNTVYNTCVMPVVNTVCITCVVPVVHRRKSVLAKLKHNADDLN
jgi:hypothetical protein